MVQRQSKGHKRKDPGRESRSLRTRGVQSGAWGSSSQDFVRLAHLIFKHSAQYAKAVDGNCSIYALAGIPLLFSAARCLLIELNSGMYTGIANKVVLEKLAGTGIESVTIVRHYRISGAVRKRLHILTQLRHEIVHPSHRPSGEKGNTPAYLLVLRKQNLLQSTGKATDYIWIAQLQSHRLFSWAFETMALTVDILLAHHKIGAFIADGLRESWWRFRTDAS